MSTVAPLPVPTKVTPAALDRLSQALGLDDLARAPFELVVLHQSWSSISSRSLGDALVELMDLEEALEYSTKLDAYCSPSLYLGRIGAPQTRENYDAYEHCERLISFLESHDDPVSLVTHAIGSLQAALRGALPSTSANVARALYADARIEGYRTARSYAPSEGYAAVPSQHLRVAQGAKWRADASTIARFTPLHADPVERELPVAPQPVPPPVDPLTRFRLFDPAQADAVFRGEPTASQESNGKQRRVLQAMSMADGTVHMAQVPQGQPLAELYARFPHFKEVIDFVVASLALASCGSQGRPLRMPAILLRGAPGTGKTYFAQELARLLGTHFVEKDLSVTSEAFVISGMDSTWKNSKPGIVFETLVNGACANPLICLNEVDKCTTEGHKNSPLAALYALLEPTSACKFQDEFVPVDLDASRVLWVLTANDGLIPAPILSRLEVFDVRAPTEAECRAIARSVWASVCERSMPAGHPFSVELPAELLGQMSKVNPRDMRKRLTFAASLAAVAGRSVLAPEDLHLARERYRPSSAGIGFMASGVER